MSNTEDGNEGCSLTIINATGKMMSLTANNVTEGDQTESPATSLQDGLSTTWGIRGADMSMTGCSGNFTYTIEDSGNPAVTVTWSFAKPYDGDNSFTCLMGGGDSNNYVVKITPPYSPSDTDFLANTTSINLNI